MSYAFSGTEPKAQQKTQSLREQCADGFEKHLKTFKFSPAKTSATGCCEEFGDDDDDQDMADEMSTASSLKNTQVEKLGELGAIAYLQLTVEGLGYAYDFDNLVQFSGNGCFNAIYFHPSLANATHAIIVEAKGGTSACGDRDDGSGSGMRVQQGTPDYAEVIMDVMARSKDTDRADAGVALQQIANRKPPRIAYLGVRTAYDKKKLLIHNPVPIFFETV